MNDIFPLVAIVVLVILTIVLSVVGIQFILVLAELKRTLKKVNDTVDQAEAKMNALIEPLQNLGGIASGVQTGIKVFEAFVGWLNKKKSDKE